MPSVIQEAANDQLRRYEFEAQNLRNNRNVCVNNIKSLQAQIAWLDAHLAQLDKDIAELKKATKGKGKRNVKSASKSRRVRL